MKILWLYSSNSKNPFPHWYTGDFFRLLNGFPNVEIKSYGKGVHMCDYPEMHLVKYYSKINLSMKDLKKLFKFDIILLSSRMRYTDWLPDDFSTFNCPKVLIEGDYHNHRKDSWFKESNINLILHRHKNNVLIGKEDFSDISQQWFPVSVDTSIFKPSIRNEQNKIGFIGSIDKTNQIYIHRIKAIQILQKKKLLRHYNVDDKTYPEILKKNVAFLNGSSIYNIDNAKAFEIMATGKILLTNHCKNGFYDLFGNNTYVTYQNDMSDLISKAQQILKDKDYREYIKKNALKRINKYHTHYIRATELIEILENL